MKWKLELSESWKPVYYSVKLIGLAPFTIKNYRFHPPSILCKFYPVVLATIYSLYATQTLILTIGNLKVGNSPVLMEILTAALYVISIASTCVTPIIFLWMNKKILYLMNKLCIVSNELKSLGIEEDHQNFFKNLLVFGIKGNAILIATCVMLCFTDQAWSISVEVKYAIDSFFGFNTVLIFAQILIYIKQRFVLLNKRLSNMMVPVHRLACDPHRSRIFVVSRDHRDDDDQQASEGLTDLQRFQKIKAMHFELCDLVARTSHVFAFPILFTSIRLFSQFMLVPYWTYFVLRNLGQFKILIIFCSALRIAIASVTLLIIAHASAVTCEQGKATRVMLSKVWIKFRPAKLQDEFILFSTQLIQTPVAVSTFGFLALDYSFVLKVFCATVTYLIVIIQLDTR